MFNTFAGYNAGINAAASDNSFFGYKAGERTTSGYKNSFFGENAGQFNTTGIYNTAIGYNSSFNQVDLFYATAIGADSRVLDSNTIALGRTNGFDKVVVYGLGNFGSASLCINASNQLSSCSSSLRYKSNVQAFTGGLEIVRRLRPIRFNWRNDGMEDVGFAAEEVEKTEPLLATRNRDGQIEGVKYGQITTVLVNAVKEQQSQIEQQKEQIAEQQRRLLQQQRQLEVLKRLVCASHRRAAVCQ